MEPKVKCGILLTNIGTPNKPTAHEIRKFLRKFLSDKRIVPMNRVAWWFILHFFILPKRGKENIAKYEAIWTEEGSPFTIAHEKLAVGLRRALEKGGWDDVVVISGMNYSEPSINAAMAYLKREGCTNILFLPLYPQSAFSTTSAALDALHRSKKKLSWDVSVQIIENYYSNSLYIKAIAASIKNAGFKAESDDRILFSFHSIPLSDIESGDTYELQADASCLQIASELGLERKRWTIGFQCRFDKGREWLSPFTHDILDRWAETGGGRVFYVCPGFAVDCLETIYDIGHTIEPRYREARKAAGWECREDDFVSVPCLNGSKAHIKVLTHIVQPKLNETCGEEGR